ncbi:MAG TPA: FAD-binding oxidoreductase [Candidatus Methylomirabilis sp.]
MPGATEDVVIVGGGVMGSAVAYHLLAGGFRGSVLVAERDLAYREASSALSVGGIRQQFGAEINVRIARHTLEFYERFPDLMAVGDERPDIAFRRCGYLFLADAAAWPGLRARAGRQRAWGADVQVLEGTEILAVVPDLNLEGIVGATFGPRDGWVDPYSVTRGLARKARALGARYVEDEVVGIAAAAGRVAVVTLRDEGRVEAGAVVNAAGPWAGRVAGLAGVDLPVGPIRRQVYVGRPARRLGYDLPLVIAPDGLYFRSEAGGRILCGKSFDFDPHEFDFTWQRDLFERALWRPLAQRLPPCQQFRLERGWAGLYDENPLDHNAIIGEHPDLGGFYCINGFSGHGFQQAPAAGQGIAELLLHGRYTTLDLTPLRPSRFREGRPVLEEAIV